MTERPYSSLLSAAVRSVKLITMGTVEEKVLAMQLKKKSVVNAMTWEDIQELLTL